MSMGWACSRCTYRHLAPGTRCVMCNELRVNKEKMRDFILGKEIPEANRINSNSIGGVPPKTVVGAASPTAAAEAGCRKRTLSQQNMNNAFASSSPSLTAATSLRRSATDPSPSTAARKKPTPQKSLSQQFIGTSFRSASPTASPVATTKKLPAQSMKTSTVLNNPYARGLRSTAQSKPSNTILQQQQQQQRPPPAPKPIAGVNASNSTASSAAGVPRPPPPPNNIVQPQAFPTTTVAQQQRSSVAEPTAQSIALLPQGTVPHPAHVQTKNLKPAPAVAHFSNTESASFRRTAAAAAQIGRPQNAHRMASTNAASKNLFTMAAATAESKQHASFTHRRVYEPGPVPLDSVCAKTWIYPTADAYPKRQYQYDIAETAVLHNTLVSLPTGLGKTLVAAVVMYNYYRWFPTGKVIFMAPTLPLVRQQVQACYDIMGIPATDTALLTGKIQANQRATIWSQKRVFFCTPQTVQKDLENGRFDPSQVVCGVFDEAHKACGEYAYCKVVEQLEEAGAKFRVLGLSATPGTNLKAIQKVVDALRISCIEARSDSDPDVSQYVHHRETEVIVVPQVTASKLVERAIDEIIHPVLDRLRNSGATPQRFPGNATVTAWCVQRAKQEYQKRPDHQGSLLGYFTVGHYFVQLRADLHRHGIGVVRNKLVQLKGSSQRGYMSTVVKGSQFQRLWDQVTDSSWDPNAEGTAQDRLKNNPKLSKLLEILTEHFERARACDSSSRAIVFSQFRDSVQEIESILQTCQPLIRGRHFVGQGKGSKAETGQKLGGMNQAEQQGAIGQFKDGTYNVLVCTCIGEEGLDIGEVDLIVNFDCLRSPIRMIQRVGRTGRKRDGRVVCLAAAGSEERTLKQSKVDERKLHHALKNPRSFKVIPSALMFPEDPVVSERNMSISQNFHMSQVDGVTKTKKRDSTCGTELKLAGRGRWQLTHFEEQKRVHFLGKLKDTRMEEAVESVTLPKELSRRLLFARSMSVSRFVEKKRHRSLLGRTCEILREFENSHSRTEDVASLCKVGRVRTARSAESALDSLFPLTISDPRAEEDTTISLEVFALDIATATVDHETQTGLVEAVPSTKTLDGRLSGSILDEKDDADERLARREQRRINETNMPKVTSQLIMAKTDPVCEPNEPALPVRNNPYASRPKEANAGIRALYTKKQAANNKDGNSDHFHAHAADARAQQDDFTADPLSKSSHHAVEPNSDALEMQVSKELQNNPPYDKDTIPSSDVLGMNEFRLPRNDTDNSESENRESAAPLKANGIAEDVFRLPSQSSDEEDAAEKTGFSEMNAQEDLFRLPTPEPSSSEEESDHEEAVVTSHEEMVQAGNLNEKERNTQADTSKRESSSQPSRQLSVQVRFSLDSTAGSLNVDESPELALPQRKRAAKRTNILAIEDTPDSNAVRSLSAQATSIEQSSSVAAGLDHGLSNTQDDGEGPNSCCAVCFSKRLSEEDPIILCDGPGDGTSCSLAVHVSCYSAVVNLHDDSDWRCDICEFRRNGGGGQMKIQCSLCHHCDGVLKRNSANEWKHMRCLKRLRRSKKHDDSSASIRGDVQGELRRPLADLSPNDEYQDDAADRKKRRRQFFQRFIDDEAEAEDEDGDEAEDDIMAIEDEEEERAEGFINDSSQLGFTQDELDRADPHDAFDDTAHRSLDNERERMRQFKTPLLNRRMHERNENSEWSPTPGSAPDSQKGLGNMHFIRSVLEHHRQGGDADEIEQMYKRLENEADFDEENDE